MANRNWRQKIFDTVAAAILRQGGGSIDDHGICLYRGPNGRKCAIGHLIPDQSYDPSMEGKSMKELSRRFPALFPAARLDFLTELQWAHDAAGDEGRFVAEGGGFMVCWAREMRRLAAYYDLHTEELDARGN